MCLRIMSFADLACRVSARGIEIAQRYGSSQSMRGVHFFEHSLDDELTQYGRMD